MDADFTAKAAERLGDLADLGGGLGTENRKLALTAAALGNSDAHLRLAEHRFHDDELDKEERIRHFPNNPIGTPTILGALTHVWIADKIANLGLSPSDERFGRAAGSGLAKQYRSEGENWNPNAELAEGLKRQLGPDPDKWSRAEILGAIGFIGEDILEGAAIRGDEYESGGGLDKLRTASPIVRPAALDKPATPSPGPDGQIIDREAFFHHYRNTSDVLGALNNSVEGNEWGYKFKMSELTKALHGHPGSDILNGMMITGDSERFFQEVENDFLRAKNPDISDFLAKTFGGKPELDSALHGQIIDREKFSSYYTVFAVTGDSTYLVEGLKAAAMDAGEVSSRIEHMMNNPELLGTFHHKGREGASSGNPKELLKWFEDDDFLPAALKKSAIEIPGREHASIELVTVPGRIIIDGGNMKGVFRSAAEGTPDGNPGVSPSPTLARAISANDFG